MSPPLVIAHRGDSAHRPEHTLASFARALVRCRAMAPEMLRGHLFGKGQVGEMLEGAREVGSGLIMPEKKLLSDELRDRAREAGVKVATWVVDEVDELRRLMRFELYGVGSNRPGEMLEALQAL